MWRGRGAGLALLGLTNCYPADAPDTAHLPGCFAKGVPQARPGMALVRLRWVHQRDSAFRARGVQMSVDGRQVYESRDEAKLERELAELADVELTPGPHQWDSLVRVSGWGSGVFAYLQGYRFEVPKRLTFTVEPGSVSCLSVVVHYRDGLTLPLEERPVARLSEERAR